MAKRNQKQWYRHGSWWRKLRINRRYKDVLFRKLFHNKQDLLDLYNALNGSTYIDPEALEVVTLEDVIFMKMKNDLSFIIGNSINLYEHQSTWNPNMPLRGMLYFAQQFEGLVNARQNDLYGRRRIELPTPTYIVFYNGSDLHTDNVMLYLSDSFSAGKGSGCLECTCKVLNINRGYNMALMEKCHRLWEYSELTSEIEDNIRGGMQRREAVETAIDTCIKRGILTDILLKEKAEVTHMLLTEYDEKRHLRNTFIEGREEGFEQGRTEGLKQGRIEGLKQGRTEGLKQGRTEGLEQGRTDKLLELVQKKLSRGKTISEIAEELEEEEAVIEQLLHTH